MRGVKTKPKKRSQTKPDNPAQSARFIKAAKELGFGEPNPEFERALDVLIPKKSKSEK